MSSFVDQTSGSVAHCEAMANHFSDLAEEYYTPMATYCQQKLWHQLTLLILEFLSNPKTTLREIAGDENKNTFLALYRQVVLAVAKKLNSLALARVGAAVAYANVKEGSVEESTTLLKDLLKQLQEQPNHVPSTLFLQAKIAFLQLSQQTSPAKEQVADIYSTIKTNAPLLNQLMPDTPEAMIVHSAHYEMSMTYYKLIGPPEAYYDEAIHYLNYYQPSEEETSKSHALGVDLCLAALTGEGIYNLGQVVNNPILKALLETPDAWLVELLQACAQGNVSQVKTLCSETYPAQLAAQPALVNMSTKLEEKVTLLALVEMVFERPASERTLTFVEIAERLQISVDQVEWVIMRSFSVHLMEGSMDQVAGTVHVTWVLPRVLDNQQMADLGKRFGEWAGKVGKIQEYMQENATLAA